MQNEDSLSSLRTRGEGVATDVATIQTTMESYGQYDIVLLESMKRLTIEEVLPY